MSASLIASLAACGSIGPATVSSISGNYDPGEYARAADAKAIPVTVQGSAFGLDQSALASTVANNMKGQDWAGHGRFTTSPGADNDRTFSFAFMLNGPTGITAEALCKRPAAVGGSGAVVTGDVSLVAALCRFDQAATTVQGRVSGATGPQDPKFAALIAAATRDLTPTMIDNNLEDSSSSSNSD
jgi:hypothetical protein